MNIIQIGVVSSSITNVSLLATPLTSLTEITLDGAIIDLDLTGRNYVSTNGALLISYFTLNNAPTGVTIVNKSRPTSTKARIGLAFNGTDFDADITNFSITIAGAAFLPSSTPLTSQNVTITAIIEPAIYSLPYSEVFGKSGSITPGVDYNIPHGWTSDDFGIDIFVYPGGFPVPACDVVGSSGAQALNFLNSSGLQEYITTAPFSTISKTNITISWNEFRNGGAPVLSIEWSLDNSIWVPIVYLGVTDDDTWYAITPLVLPIGANNQSTVYIRFGQLSDGGNTVTGIDDFLVIGT